MRVFEVGGSIRDRLILGVSGNDFDFCVEAESLEALIQSLESDGVVILHKFPERLTVKAQMPMKTVKDFVLCRTDEVYENNRLVHCRPGTLYQDMMRRDFTVNAIARDVHTEEVFDFFGGLADCENRVLRTVGDPVAKLSEDPRRILRGFRFMVQCGLTPDPGLASVLFDESVIGVLRDPLFKDFSVKEINKAFKLDPVGTMKAFSMLPVLASVLFDGHLNLLANSKAK